LSKEKELIYIYDGEEDYFEFPGYLTQFLPWLALGINLEELTYLDETCKSPIKLSSANQSIKFNLQMIPSSVTNTKNITSTTFIRSSHFGTPSSSALICQQVDYSNHLIESPN
jgi:hypothetical protein